MPKQIEVVTITPAGKERRAIVKNRREAGKIVAYTLADNTNTDRKTCTAIAMDAEKTGRASWLGYFFIIGRVESPTTPEPLPIDPEHLRPVFNPQPPKLSVTSTHAEPLTLALQFTGTATEIDRSKQRIAGQLEMMEG